MTPNGPPKNIEFGPETFPTLDEVIEIIRKFTGSNEYEEVWSPRHDERGLYAWKVLMETADGSTEYEYTRGGGPHPGGKGLQTAVYATFYNKDGMPLHGSSVAKLINNKWNTELIDLRTWLPK